MECVEELLCLQNWVSDVRDDVVFDQFRSFLDGDATMGIIFSTKNCGVM